MNKDTPESLGFDRPAKPKTFEKLTLDQRKARMVTAYQKGMQQQNTIEETVYLLWKITPNFHRKDWKELIQYLKEAGDPVGKLEAFGKWWQKEDWRGKQGQAPTADQIRTYLPRALEMFASHDENRRKYLKWEE
jgi:hypothetical protein